jgi:uncharacterized protein (DUF2461 family)
MTAFDGFPPETIRFLRELRVNNRKDWFDAHRVDYEAYWVAPAKAFVVAAGQLLAELAPQIRAEPRVLGSIFRINRDTRFSRDQRPYKDHLDVWFWEGERRRAVSGFFARLTPEHLGVGASCHGLDKRPRQASPPTSASRPPRSWPSACATGAPWRRCTDASPATSRRPDGRLGGALGSGVGGWLVRPGGRRVGDGDAA